MSATAKKVLGPGVKKATMRKAAVEAAGEGEEKVSGEAEAVGDGNHEEKLRSDLTVQYEKGAQKLPSWLEDYEVKTVWVETQCGPEQEGEGTVIVYNDTDTQHQKDPHKVKVKVKQEQGEAEAEVEDEEIDEEIYYLEEDEENLEGGVEDAEFELVEETELGQEEQEERSEMVRSHRKRKEFEVFVGGLDWDATERDIRRVFEKVGDVTDVRLMMNRTTGRNKGYAFVRYATVEQAARAALELKNPKVRNKRCRVTASQECDTLFVGNICPKWTQDRFREKLEFYGVDNFSELTLMEDKRNEGMNRGFAFLEFLSLPEAMKAYRRLKRRDIYFGVDQSARVDFANYNRELDGEHMEKVRMVFIDGVPPEWDEELVRSCLKKYGIIEKLDLAINLPNARRSDFCRVTYDTHQNAVACARSVNECGLGRGDYKVKVRASLCRPWKLRPRMWSPRGSNRVGRGRSSYSPSPPPRRLLPARVSRQQIKASQFSPVRDHGFKRPKDLVLTDKHSIVYVPKRARHRDSPEPTHDRRLPVSDYYPEQSARREYARYDSRVVIERQSSAYRHDYYSASSRELVYANRHSHHHADVSNKGKVAIAPPTVHSYREGPMREYSSRSKRPYIEIDDDPEMGHGMGIRRPRARLEYDVGTSSSGNSYIPGAETYSERHGRSHIAHCSQCAASVRAATYSSRHGVAYIGGSSSTGVVRVHPSSVRSSYLSRGSDVVDSSRSSPPPRRRVISRCEGCARGECCGD